MREQFFRKLNLATITFLFCSVVIGLFGMGWETLNKGHMVSREKIYQTNINYVATRRVEIEREEMFREKIAIMEQRVIELQEEVDKLKKPLDEVDIDLNIAEEPQKVVTEGEIIDMGKGGISWFGGPDDKFMPPNNKVSLYDTKLKDLDPNEYYCAVRFDPKMSVRRLRKAKVHVFANGKTLIARIVDWGPSETHPRAKHRVIDASPAILRDLGVDTDDEVEVILEVPYLHQII